MLDKNQAKVAQKSAVAKWFLLVKIPACDIIDLYYEEPHVMIPKKEHDISRITQNAKQSIKPDYPTLRSPWIPTYLIF